MSDRSWSGHNKAAGMGRGMERGCAESGGGGRKLTMSGHMAMSLALLLVAAVLYLVSVGTNSWSCSGQVLTLGLWKFCMLLDGDGVWTCLSNKTDFTVAAQAFSMLAVLCYAVSFLLYLVYILFPTVNRSRALTVALCLLGFSIVCLQMMTMIVYGVKMEQLYRKVERVHFRRRLEPLTIAWSFAFAILSSLTTTAAGVCTFLELRNITLEDLEGTSNMATL